MANVPLLLAVFFAIATVVYGDKGAKAKTNKPFKSMKSTKASKANASKSNDVLKSVSQIQFDNESNTLFVVDWKQEKILAFLLVSTCLKNLDFFVVTSAPLLLLLTPDPLL